MHLILGYWQGLAERLVDVRHLYPVFGNQSINNIRDFDSGAYVAERGFDGQSRGFSIRSCLRPEDDLHPNYGPV